MLLGPTLKVRLFGLLKIPLIGYVRPRVERLDEDEVTIRVPLGRRTKNHWGSMYFGALAIGADLAAGTHAMFAVDEAVRTGERVNVPVPVECIAGDETVARFSLTLSLKRK